VRRSRSQAHTVSPPLLSTFHSHRRGPIHAIAATTTSDADDDGQLREVDRIEDDDATTERLAASKRVQFTQE
jgi:hypothetical protein